MPCSWACCKASADLMDEVAGMHDRQRALVLDERGQIEPVHVLHRVDDALADSRGRVRRDDVGMPKLGDRSDFPHEPFEHGGPLDQVLAHQFDRFVPAHQTVVDQVDDTHSATSQLADDLVVGVVDQFRGRSVRREIG